MILAQRSTTRGFLAGVARPELVDMVQAMLEVAGNPEAGIELLLVEDSQMAYYNQSFLELPGPTNVLSFPADEGEASLGQIVLNLDAMRREALLYGQDPVEHLARLLSHGVLHLSGLDHGPLMDDLTEAAMDAALSRLNEDAA